MQNKLVKAFLITANITNAYIPIIQMIRNVVFGNWCALAAVGVFILFTRSIAGKVLVVPDFLTTVLIAPGQIEGWR